jgi:5'(3')-deoxyribonucleotidase
LIGLYCSNNPLEYPIPHKFYNDQKQEWLKELNIKLSSYEHQKRLINEHGVYIMKKFENHPELINDKIKEENPTYFLSVEYGF